MAIPSMIEELRKAAKDPTIYHIEPQYAYGKTPTPCLNTGALWLGRNLVSSSLKEVSTDYYTESLLTILALSTMSHEVVFHWDIPSERSGFLILMYGYKSCRKCIYRQCV